LAWFIINSNGRYKVLVILATTRRGRVMKTIKIYVEGGVVTDVTIPKEFHNKINYEIIDYDHIDAEREEKKNEETNTNV
tara:strand:+ start:258 stop:494 length:237 start_codon:yes stop_codon:yes gene_type:complete